jgi:transposase-like protein
MLRKRKLGWYPAQFKERAIALGREIGCSHAEQKLGMEPSLLGKWIREEELKQVVKKEKPSTEELELARELQRLKRENQELKQANTILKEIAHSFSKDRPNRALRRSLNSQKKKQK